MLRMDAKPFQTSPPLFGVRHGYMKRNPCKNEKLVLVDCACLRMLDQKPSQTDQSPPPMNWVRLTVAFAR